MGERRDDELSRVRCVDAASTRANVGGRRDAECSRSVRADLGTGADARDARPDEPEVLALPRGGQEARVYRSPHLQRRPELHVGPGCQAAFETLLAIALQSR